MAVHAARVEVRRHPVSGVAHNLMLAVGFIAVIALLAVGLLILLGSIPTTSVDPNILQVEKLQELRMSVGGGGFI